MKEYSEYRFDGDKKLDLKEMDTDGEAKDEDREEILAKTDEIREKIIAYQDKFYASGREGLILLIQARDAAGKDSTVKHVMSGVNPQGVDVYSFKQPSREELAHDFLWRAGRHLPERGKIAIFNRSYYEDVLVVRVDKLYKNYRMPEEWLKQSEEKIFRQRYEDIRHFESYLTHNGYRIIKIFLNVSKEEQKKRFLERIDKPEKNWKFSSGDLDVRARWDEYSRAYEECINRTATPEAPWYVLPADQKWYTRYLVSEVLLDTFEKIDPEYPELSQEAKAELAECRRRLASE